MNTLHSAIQSQLPKLLERQPEACRVLLLLHDIDLVYANRDSGYWWHSVGNAVAIKSHLPVECYFSH